MDPNMPAPVASVVSSNQSIFRQKKFYASLFVVILALISIPIFLFRQKISFNLEQKNAISPDILELTAPVKSLYGTVEKVEGNMIIVRRQGISPSEGLIYKVVIAAETMFSRPQVASPSGTVSRLDIKDVKKGDMVSIFTQSDLRLLPNREFKASSVELVPKLYY